MKEVLGAQDIIRAVNQVLNENFPEVGVMSGEAKEGFYTPSFFVEIFTRPVHHAKVYKKTTALINIRYMTEEGRQADNLKMLDDLVSAFGDILTVKGQPDKVRYLKLYGIDTRIDEEGTAHFEFNLDFVTFIERPEVEREIMKDLDIQLEKEE